MLINGIIVWFRCSGLVAAFPFLAVALIAFICGSVAYGDVFMKDAQLLLPSDQGITATPGGRRTMCLNNSCYTATRVYTDKDVHDTFSQRWQSLNAGNRAVEAKAIRQRIFQQQIEDQVDPDSDTESFTVKRFVKKALDHHYASHELINKTLEAPFAFESGGWHSIARLPVSAISQNSRLGSLDITDGYIMMKDPAQNSMTGYWVLRFLPGFNLLNIFSDHNGDAPGADPDRIVRSPQTRRILHFSEKADRWEAQNWVYEGSGSPSLHADYYRQHFALLGLQPASETTVNNAGMFMQYRDPERQQDVGLFATDSPEKPGTTRIVLQIRNANRVTK